MTAALLIGDTHGDSETVRICLKDAQPGQLVVQLGDFGLWHGFQGQHFLDNVQRLCEEKEIVLNFIDGNHDDHQQRLQMSATEPTLVRPLVRYLPRGYRFTDPDGARWGVLGGAFSVDYSWRTNGINWWKTIEEVQQKDVDRLGDEPLDILLTHDCPMELPIVGGLRLRADTEQSACRSRHLISQAVRRTKPRILVHGHWHVPLVTQLEEPPLTVFSLPADGDPGSAFLLNLTD